MALRQYFKAKKINLNPEQDQVAIELSKRIGQQKRLNWFAKHHTSVYLWGDVGRGKTMLMDGFFSLIQTKALRVHYHEFFKDLYGKLKGSKKQTQELKAIASQTAKEYQVICFDEFHLHDITNTVLMTVFLKVLIEKKVQIILTSNYHPESLLPDPTMHKHALPLIDLIMKNFTLMNLAGKKDYRFEIASTQKKKNSFVFPNDGATQQKLKTMIVAGSKSTAPLRPGEIHFTMGSSVETEMMNDDSVWFKLQQICGGNFSHLDYLEVANRWKKVVLLDIKRKYLATPSTLRRFVWLIDIFYDQKVELFITSESDILEMLKEIEDFADLNRTISRLSEMQSVDFHHSK